MDPETRFRNHVERMLITASWAHQARHLLGIVSVDQIWEDTPGWYFRISGMPGTYELGLREVLVDGDGHTGIFVVRFFPHPQEAARLGFSQDEQRLLAGPWFDETSTPTFELRGELGREPFQVAVVEVSSRGDGFASYCLESADRLRIRCRRLAAEDGSVVWRDVPGWQLALPLFDRLVGLHAYHEKAAPQQVRFARGRGFEHYQGAGDLECQESNDIWVNTLVVAFGKCPVRAPDQPVAESVLFDGDAPCGLNPGAAKHPLVNPLWWQLSVGHFPSDLGSTCGCCDHD